MLTTEAAQLAIDLELLSHGAVTSWTPNGRSHADSRIPTGDSNPPHLQFLDAYSHAYGPRRRQQVISHYRGVLKAHRGRKSLVKGESSVQEQKRMIEDGAGWSVDEVARSFRCTPTRVRKVRRDAGVDEETGKLSRATQALLLREKGLTQAEIAKRLVTSQPTVNRLLKAEKHRRGMSAA